MTDTCRCGDKKKINHESTDLKSEADFTQCGNSQIYEGSSCCCSPKVNLNESKAGWIIGQIKTPAGIVPKVSTHLTFCDRIGSWKARWGINRMNYKVEPGIYAIGEPNDTSPVLVTANYKMTFDRVRSELYGVNAWLLVLDTKGINVWCAAGKGTFGTKELVNRIQKVKLYSIVSHRVLVLPQLGAPGVAAYEVQKNTQFRVTYGPVRAQDIKEYLESGMKATPEMRKVHFTTYDRLVLTPIELVSSIKISLIVFGIMFILNQIGIGRFGVIDLYAYIGSVIVGCIATPILLPWIPGRAFAWKGWLLGLLWAAGVNMLNGYPGKMEYDSLVVISYMLVLPSISSFFAMNFTGSSTYTSLSGVQKEMKIAVPVIIASLSLGTLLLLINGCIKV